MVLDYILEIDRLRANDNEAIRKSVVTKMLELEKQIQAQQAAEAAAEPVEEIEEEPAPVAEVKEEPEKKEERGIAFSPRFRSASFSISAGNGFTPAPTPEESLSSALNEEDDVLGNPDFDPEQYNSSDVPSSTAKKEDELLRKMGLK